MKGDERMNRKNEREKNISPSGKLPLEVLDVYESRKDGKTIPEGSFDEGGRWYPSNNEKASCCVKVRKPSRNYPFSLYQHCKTLKHLKNLIAEGKKPHELRYKKRLPKMSKDQRRKLILSLIDQFQLRQRMSQAISKVVNTQRVHQILNEFIEFLREQGFYVFEKKVGEIVSAWYISEEGFPKSSSDKERLSFHVHKKKIEFTLSIWELEDWREEFQ